MAAWAALEPAGARPRSGQQDAEESAKQGRKHSANSTPTAHSACARAAWAACPAPRPLPQVLRDARLQNRMRPKGRMNWTKKERLPARARKEDSSWGWSWGSPHQRSALLVGEHSHEQPDQGRGPRPPAGQRVDPEPGVDHPQVAVRVTAVRKATPRPAAQRAGRAAPGRTRAPGPSSCVPGRRASVEGQAGGQQEVRQDQVEQVDSMGALPHLQTEEEGPERHGVAQRAQPASSSSSGAAATSTARLCSEQLGCSMSRVLAVRPSVRLSGGPGFRAGRQGWSPRLCWFHTGQTAH